MTRKGILLLVIVLSLSVLVACGNLFSTETQGGATSLQPVIMETLPAEDMPVTIETPPVDVAPGAETIPAPEEKKMFLSEEIEYGGRVFDFEISVLTSDKIMMDTFEKFGIEDIGLNEDNPNSREIIGKTLAYSQLETFNFQNKTNVRLDEYLANPGNYPARVMASDVSGEVVEQIITFDQIKSFEIRYTSGLKGERFYTFPGLINAQVGYSYDNRNLVFYESVSPGDSNLKQAVIMEEQYPKTEVASWISLLAVFEKYREAASLMPYSVFRIVENKTLYDLESDDPYSDFNSLIGFGPMKGMTWGQANEYIKKILPFAVTLK